VIAGNHEISFDLANENQLKQRFYGNKMDMDFAEIKAVLTSCPDLIYLEDSSVTIDGVKFWGSPYQPPFHDWAFNRSDEERQVIYSNIPDDVDVLLSHGPPYQILDLCYDGTEAGCPILYDEIFNRIKPKMVVFGHIHEAAGHKLIDGINFVNASTCNLRY
jgi:Icc-related predicted phosphoesterase